MPTDVKLKRLNYAHKGKITPTEVKTTTTKVKPRSQRHNHAHNVKTTHTKIKHDYRGKVHTYIGIATPREDKPRLQIL